MGSLRATLQSPVRFENPEPRESVLCEPSEASTLPTRSLGTGVVAQTLLRATGLTEPLRARCLMCSPSWTLVNLESNVGGEGCFKSPETRPHAIPHTALQAVYSTLSPFAEIRGAVPCESPVAFHWWRLRPGCSFGRGVCSFWGPLNILAANGHHLGYKSNASAS